MLLPAEPRGVPPAAPRPGAAGGALVPLLLLAFAFASFALLGERRRREAARPPVWIDPATLAWDHLPDWADQRWGAELQAGMAELVPATVDDTAALEGWLERLSSFSFVRGVRRFAPQPDGRLEVSLELRLPVACLPVGDLFYAVADDGTVLSGAWSVPPRVRGRWLPVIGPLSDASGLFERSRPGDFLVEDEHVAALDVALSMQAELSDQEAERLGRIVIDASRVDEISVEEPGIRLLLEDRRLALFGRPPYADAPGELPAARKWRSLVAALDLDQGTSGAAPVDWSVVDLRWDRPGIRLRGAAAEAEAEERLAAHGTPERAERRDEERAPHPAPRADEPAGPILGRVR